MKDWKCRSVDEKCGGQWMTGFGCKLFTALSRWNSLSSLIEKLLRIYGICGKIIVILVEHWAGGDIDSLVEAQMFHIAVCSCKTGSLEQNIFWYAANSSGA